MLRQSAKHLAKSTHNLHSACTIVSRASFTNSFATLAARQQADEPSVKRKLDPWDKTSPTLNSTYKKYAQFDDMDLDFNVLLEDFRDLQAFCNVGTGKNSNVEGARAYKSAERALQHLTHESAGSTIKVSQARTVIAETNGNAWKVIRDRALNGTNGVWEKLDEKTKAIVNLCRVHDIGPAKAAKFYEDGYRTRDDLHRHPKLTKAQKLGLRHFDDMQRLIPRAECDVYNQAFKKGIAGDPRFQGEVMGSYRRGIPMCSDVDFVVSHPAYDTIGPENGDISKGLLEQIIGSLKAADILLPEHLSYGNQKWLGFAKLPGDKYPHVRRIDIRVVPHSSYHYTALGSTGDLDLMKWIRTVADNKGLLLNEYGMSPRLKAADRGINPRDGKPYQVGADTLDLERLIYVKSEQEIFQHLGLPYIPPEQRNYQHYNRVLRPFLSSVHIARPALEK